VNPVTPAPKVDAGAEMTGAAPRTSSRPPYGNRQVFIYYRLTPSVAPEVQREVAVVQRELVRDTPGLSARLLVREPQGTSDVTCMEIYTIDATARPEGVDAPLQARIEHRLTPVVGPHAAGGRHVEVFEECPSSPWPSTSTDDFPW
jgi:hypothetical protein